MKSWLIHAAFVAAEWAWLGLIFWIAACAGYQSGREEWSWMAADVVFALVNAFMWLLWNIKFHRGMRAHKQAQVEWLRELVKRTEAYRVAYQAMLENDEPGDYMRWRVTAAKSSLLAHAETRGPW